MPKKYAAAIIHCDEDSLTKLVQITETQNCSISRFTDPERALSHIAMHQPQIVITDYRLHFPGRMTGVEVLDRTKHSSPMTQVIVLGDSNSNAIEKAGGIFVSKNHAQLQLPGAIREAKRNMERATSKSTSPRGTR